ncbi:MAG TPA: hypothetical protein ENL21_08430 [Caldithrix abyssi]|uniref:Peptidase M48 domain-containing protein n=1 Tax=Caldithrix abyssi TaxID=187145 RepID=A0A7V5LJ62_CALAY|nr:hypothetical protein [Caldithrix abyssi]
MADLFYKLGKRVGKSIVKGKYLYNSAFGSEEEALNAEYRLGSLLAGEIENQNGLFDSPLHQLFLDSILKRLVMRVKNKNRVFFVKILNANDLNAFALPGGFIFVTAALVEQLQNETDEMAFVLAHEIIHIVSKHPFKRMVASYSLEALQRFLKGGTVIKTLGQDIIKKVVNSHYSQANEFQADEYGARLIYSAGFDPQGALALLKRFKSMKTEEKFFYYFSTHPPLEQRIKRIKRMIK